MNSISVRHLGKKYKLYQSPRGRFIEYLSAGRFVRHSDFWALQDITFDVPAGTTLGILGQNGSGKSTLLSVLAGVLEPDTGDFVTNGKVSAILELGSGFHPEFTGRENVYMYGSIMGLSKEQIDERLDNIIMFSELGDFMDQPLRTYSSGMIVRLAFSVAVNVNADILIVDEALAVGDAMFQHRCFRKIREMQNAGKTILYVGHDIEAVRNLCTAALLLDGGRIIERGEPHIVVNKYFALIADRERTYNEGNLVEHGASPKDDYETVYDLIKEFSGAKVESATEVPVQIQTIEIQSNPRRVIFAHPPSKITFRISAEQGESLAFAIGILPAAWDKIPHGVKFDVDVVQGERVKNIFSRVLQPKRNLGDRGWHNFIVPLEGFHGGPVSLVLSTSGYGDDLSYCWSSWGWVRIIRLRNESPEKILNNNLSEIRTAGEERFGNKRGEITNVEIFDKDYAPANVFSSGDIAHVKIHILLHEDIPENLVVGCTFKTKYCDIYGMNTKWQNLDLGVKKRGDSFVVEFSQNLKFNTGTYALNAGLVIARSDTDIEVLDRRYDCQIFRVERPGDMQGIVDLESSLKIINEYPRDHS